MNREFHGQVWEVPPTVSPSWSIVENMKVLKKNKKNPKNPRSAEVN